MNSNNDTIKSPQKKPSFLFLNDNQLLLRLSLFFGTIIRIFYIIASPVIQSRQYDLGSVSPSENIYTGHLGYIYYLNTFRHFTDFDPREVYQFFHPPLHHIIEAFWMEIIKLFTNSQDIINEWLQVPTCIYSILILFTVLAILKELNITGKGAVIAFTIVAFQPSLIFMAGSLNNDGLSFLFMFLIIYMTIKWYRTKSNFDIVLLAICIGAGMITKLSVGMMAVPVAFVFLYVFISEWKKDGFFPIKYFLQYVLFGIVCVPLGLCWAVRCFIKFDMPLNYVNHLPEDSWQYVGNYSLLERFFLPNPVTLLNNLKNGGIGLGENMWVQLFRTAALGECDLGDFPFIGKIVMLLLMIAAFLVAAICFCFLIKVMILGKNGNHYTLNTPIRLFLAITYCVLVFFYINFCYNYPHQCTMNFRYIVPTVLMPALSLGLAVNENEDCCPNIISIVIVCYVILSVISIAFWSFCYK